MRTRTVYSLKSLADSLGLEFRGDPETIIHGLASLDAAGPGEMGFYNNPRYLPALQATQAGVVILAPEHADDCPSAMLLCTNPYVVFAQASALFVRKPAVAATGINSSAQVDPGAIIDPSAYIGPHAVIGAGTRIAAGVNVGANCVIGEDCIIGAGTRVHANVSIYDDVHIGARGIIHSSVVLGSDGFGFAFDGSEHLKIHQLGGVRIGDDVEIGACTSIDRGALNNTIIENGVKIDNQVQIAHNVQIGSHSVICGCSAIAGSSTVGKNCIIAGGVGVVNHVNICDGVTVTAMSLVNQSITKPGYYSSGTGLLETSQWKKTIVRFKQLDSIWKRLLRLEQQSADDD